MKTALFIVFALITPVVLGMEIPALPSSEFADAATSGIFCRTYEVRSRNVDPLWNLVKVTRRGLGVANESVGVELKPHGFGVTIQ